ncbi:CUB and sushi domain-containing protein 1-like [Diadema antillarum]|uniref:CUB and sushi domain-containing protein 1-like n=1 Tax=Diadema antillarum TaxID=105358 RepID=UPI003A8B6C44
MVFSQERSEAIDLRSPSRTRSASCSAGASGTTCEASYRTRSQAKISESTPRDDEKREQQTDGECDDETCSIYTNSDNDDSTLSPETPPPKAAGKTKESKKRKMKPTKKQNPYLPSRFGHGRQQYTYTARDCAPAPNTAVCRVNIDVRIDTCDAHKPPSNGYHTCSTTNGIPYGTECIYGCYEGYELVGGASNQRYARKCVQIPTSPGYVDWDRPLPSCRDITCSVLTNPENGNVVCTKENKYESICSYECNTGFRLPNGSPRDTVCLKTGWTSPQVHNCEDGEGPSFDDCQHISGCPSNPMVFYAEPNATEAFVTWLKPTASDNSGGSVSVSDSPLRNTFLPHGVYSAEHEATDEAGNKALLSLTIIVQIIYCPYLATSEGLRSSCSHGTRRGSFCTFSCSIGYRLVGERTTICQGEASQQGEWLNQPPTCEVLECPDAPSVTDGSLETSLTYPMYGSTVTYECDVGYTINNRFLKCSSALGSEIAFWEGETPVCEVETCTRPTRYGMSAVAGSSCALNEEVPYGEICEFQCDEGYTITGNNTILCGTEGEWLPRVPACEVITCQGSALPSPINGGKNGCPLSSERYGTQCTLYCDVGYQPLQPVTRTCLADDNDKGYWSDNGTITCSVVKCTPLPEPENGFIATCTLEGNRVNVTALQEYNSRCQTACNNGYTPLNSATRRCLEDGTWDGIDQICEDNTPPTVYCPSDQILIAGANKLQAIFTGDKWEPVIAHDGDVQFEAYLYQVDSQVVDGGNVPTTLWEGDHTLVYKATDVAGNSATCSFGLEVRVTRCLALHPPANGDVALIVGQGTCQGGAVFGSECRVFCDEGYLLSVADEGDDESFTLTCNRTDDTTTVGTWSDTTPQCDLVQCQIPPVTNGTVSGCPSGSAEYGDECLFRCDDGFQSSSGKRSVYRACQADGTFSGNDFHCDVPIICAPLSVPTDGSLSPESCSEASQVPYGTTCLYACDTGFLHDGPFQKTCLSTGTWNDNRDVTCHG